MKKTIKGNKVTTNKTTKKPKGRKKKIAQAIVLTTHYLKSVSLHLRS